MAKFENSQKMFVVTNETKAKGVLVSKIFFLQK